MNIKIGNIRISICRYKKVKESDVIRKKTLAFVDSLNSIIDGKLFTTVNLNYKSLDPDKSGHNAGMIIINKFLKDNNDIKLS